MGKKRSMTRWALARRLQDVALCIAAGRPIRIGGVSVRVPDALEVEEELEVKGEETELELEIKWPSTAAASPTRAARKPPRRRSSPR